MPFAAVVGALSAISSSLKVVEFVESHGLLPDSGIQSLGLEVPEVQAVERAAQALEGVVADAYNELLTGTNERIAKCLRNLNEALGYSILLPQERKTLGKAARSCICREILMIRDLSAGSLPSELEQLWGKHVCDSPST